MMHNRKGQIFLIAAVVIASSFMILKVASTTPSITEERRRIEVLLENYIFDNIVNELQNSVRYSTAVPQNITMNVHDFMNFTRTKASEHLMTVQMLFISATANATASMLNVSVVNSLGQSADVNLTLGSYSAASTIADYGRWDTNFTITPGTSYTLTAVYNGTARNMSIRTKKNKDVFNYMFDTSMVGDNSVHKSLVEGNFNIN